MPHIAAMVHDGDTAPETARIQPDVEADTWIFDLDNTLYPITPRISAQTNDLMGGFIADLLGVDRDEARRIQKAYFREYGLTIRGLMIHHGLEPEVYMDHMAQIDLSEIGPDPRLAEAIRRLDGRKIIYTNAFGRHTHDVLERLGMTGGFDVIHDIETAGYVPKPDLDAFREMCRRYGIDAPRAVMVEDTPRNLMPAAEVGMTTVWVKTEVHWARDADGADHIHHTVEDLAEWLEGQIPGVC